MTTRRTLDNPLLMSDPLAFAHAVGFHPDPQQAVVLTSAARRGILCCTRQWGKSTTTALKAAHRAFMVPGSTILIASRTIHQAGELVQKAGHFLAKCGIRRRGDGLHSVSLTLPNGSRIIAVPHQAPNVLGFSAPALILIDEAAVVPDALYHALCPMLATNNGDLWMLSTPNGKHGFFYHEWSNAANGFARISVTAEHCPRISRAFLDAEAARLPKAAFEQYYLCAFHADQDALFSDEDLAAALDPNLTPLQFPRL